MLTRITNRLRRWIQEYPEKKFHALPRFTSFSIPFLGGTVYANDNVSFFHSRKEIFDEEAYKFSSSIESPLVIDAGANIGLSVLYFKKLYPTARIIAFEPDPDLFLTLSKNIKSYGLENVDAVQAACWTTDGQLTFQKEGGHSGSLVNLWDNKNQIGVRAVDFSTYLKQPVELLKMDIEGAETDVLFHIAPYLKNVKNIVFEYHSNVALEQKLGEILLLLKQAGFRYHLKEAFTRNRPLVDRNDMLQMDLQLNVYGYRP